MLRSRKRLLQLLKSAKKKKDGNKSRKPKKKNTHSDGGGSNTINDIHDAIQFFENEYKSLPQKKPPYYLQQKNSTKNSTTSFLLSMSLYLKLPPLTIKCLIMSYSCISILILGCLLTHKWKPNTHAMWKSENQFPLPYQCRITRTISRISTLISPWLYFGCISSPNMPQRIAQDLCRSISCFPTSRRNYPPRNAPLTVKSKTQVSTQGTLQNVGILSFTAKRNGSRYLSTKRYTTTDWIFHFATKSRRKAPRTYLVSRRKPSDQIIWSLHWIHGKNDKRHDYCIRFPS